MTVITISRQAASGGDEVARRLCELLGYRPFDKALIARAAEQSGFVDAGEVTGDLDYSEENLRARGFLDRLFERSQPVAALKVWRWDEDGGRVMDELPLHEESAVALVESAIHSAYRAGNIIIIGRGGQMVLKDLPGVLHVRIVAPLETRLQHLRMQLRKQNQEFTADLTMRRKAQDLLAAQDDASREYVQRFYHVDWADPALYHVTLNLGMLTMDQAVDWIATLALGVGETEG